ncbi:MAG: FAD-dependent oxidoreductase, partial [Candidatus Hydrogenedentales bacterium]
MTTKSEALSGGPPRVLVLGSGFGAFSFLKHVDHRRYAVTVVSPRNHFLFTPLLPSTTVGTVEFRSIIEPVRLANRRLEFFQAHAVGVDLDNRVLHCEGTFQGRPFDLPYDELVIAVGAVSHTFGVPGVEEHAYFLKELSDARNIRQKIIECFERAAQPGRETGEISDLLRFVVVGGGPTGVEFAAELHDFVTRELRRWFPRLYREAAIVLVEAQNEILTSFDRKLSAYAKAHFLHSGIEVRTQTAVKAVHVECV